METKYHNPGIIPRRINRSMLSSGTHAFINYRTEDRIEGNILSRNFDGTVDSKPFNVKFDGKSFAVGSGSSKMRFYVADWEKG